MRIITYTCPDCGTVVGGNVLEAKRVTKCPRLGCEKVLEFDDLTESEREHLLAHSEKYRIQ